MTLHRLWQTLLLGLLAFLMVGCKPFASFAVSPDPVVAGQVATFDASASAAAPRPQNNTLVSYEWNFGDGKTGTGKIATHTYAQPGTYTAQLTIKDKAGRKSTVSDSVVVISSGSSGTSAPVNVTVKGADGALLSGATVVIGSASATTNVNGVATFSSIPKGDDQLIKVSLAGFVSQVIRFDVTADTTALEVGAHLLVAAQPLQIEQAQSPQVLLNPTLGASVTLPEQALVSAANGTPATGPISVRLTPWKVQGADRLATLGKGKALDAQNQVRSIASVGMLTVDFFDASGNKLQLAAGKSAVIQMDLTSADLNGQTLAEGSTVALTHFDETTGLWKEEGQGEVIASDSSPIGLAVRATVSHFSTWSWGGVYFTTSSKWITVKCVNAQGTEVRCDVTDVALYSDGATQNIYAPRDENGRFLLPLDTAVLWQGLTSGGLSGSTTTVANADITEVTILVGPTSTSNAVKCLLPDGTSVACDVTLNSTEADGSSFAASYHVPVQGATIQTNLPATASLAWQAKAFRGLGTSTVLNTGTATSTTNGAVNIQLGANQDISSRTARVQCDPTGYLLPDYTYLGDLQSCSLSISVHDASQQIAYTYQVKNMNPAVFANISIPIDGTASVSASGRVCTPVFVSDLCSVGAGMNLTYAQLSNLTTYTMRLATVLY